MAEGIINHLFSGEIKAYSAGTHPTDVNPNAIKVLHEIDIDISHHFSKNVDYFNDTVIDIVITVCNDAKETCPFYPAQQIVHKGFEDPSIVTANLALEKYRQIRNEILEWVKSDEFFTLIKS